MRIDTNVIGLIAHSFGCYIAAKAARQISDIRVLGLFAPILGYASRNPDFGVREDGLKQLEYVIRARPHTYRFGPIFDWEKVFTGYDLVVDEKRKKPIERILCVVGDKDDDFDFNVLNKNINEILKLSCGNYLDLKFHIVKDAGHSKEDLVNAYAVNELIKWNLKRGVN